LTYAWSIDESTAWPPRGRPTRPFGPTTLEVLRSCPLRGCFERSTGYERRMSFDGRIGTAFHRTLQSLAEQKPRAVTTVEIAQETRRRFDTELRTQEAHADERPRERGLPRDTSRINHAVDALVATAQRLVPGGGVGSGSLTGLSHSLTLSSPSAVEDMLDVPSRTAELEVPVASRDGLFAGRVDRAEHTDAGTHIIDYKSALRDDLPDRYSRQIQLYALMWGQTRADWPVAAEVVYPLTGAVYDVPVDVETCQRVGDECRSLVGRIEQERSAYNLATPGDVCKVCEFRPWCRPFWHDQAREKTPSIALEKARWGFEGAIVSMTSVDRYWKLRLVWRDTVVEIVAPVDRFPHLRAAGVGTLIRALDMPLHGLRQRPRARVTEWSEIFLITEPKESKEPGDV